MTLEMLAERFLDPATPSPCPATNVLWNAVLKCPQMPALDVDLYPEYSLTSPGILRKSCWSTWSAATASLTSRCGPWPPEG